MFWSGGAFYRRRVKFSKRAGSSSGGALCHFSLKFLYSAYGLGYKTRRRRDAFLLPSAFSYPKMTFLAMNSQMCPRRKEEFFSDLGSAMKSPPTPDLHLELDFVSKC